MAKDKEKDLKKESLKARFVSMAHILWGRDISELTSHEIYTTIASTLKQNITENWIKTNKAYMERQEKQIYYFSIEFLLGRLLNTNLINLGEREIFKEALKELGIDMEKFFAEEPDAGLGNGGLGRLAACFID